MADFYKFFPTLLRHEGGFVNDPDDPGGATNKGVAMRSFRMWAHMIDVEPTLENLKSLTDDQVSKIYKTVFWDGIDGDSIVNQALAEQIFDFYVNAGRNAIHCLQRALIEMGYSIEKNGRMTDETMQALNVATVSVLYRKVRGERVAYYIYLSGRSPRLKKFLNGWLARANSFDAY